MDSTPGTIVVGIDGSPASRQALAWAADQALAEHRPLTLASAVGVATPAWPSGGTTLPLEYREALQAEARAAMTEARADLERRTPGLEVHVVIEPADPRSLLLQLSEHAAMIVVGSRGRGPVRSLVLGSVSVALTRHAACPVVVHPHLRRGLVRNGIVVGADATPDSPAVLEFAYRQASVRDLPLLVVHCFWDALAAAQRRRGRPRLRGGAGHARRVAGRPRREVPRRQRAHRARPGSAVPRHSRRRATGWTSSWWAATVRAWRNASCSTRCRSPSSSTPPALSRWCRSGANRVRLTPACVIRIVVSRPPSV